MKNFTFKIICVVLLITCLGLNAQEINVDQIRNCATDEYNAQLLEKNPNMMGSEAFERVMNSRVQALGSDYQRGSVLRIPVVVHVIHSGEAIGVGRNISDAQIESQIQVLNEDFRRLVGSRGFSSDPASADTEIEFYLARQDPDCNPSTGIDRVDLSDIANSWPFQGATDDILKPLTIWDPEFYVNMWTVDFSDPTLLGYAQFPGGTPSSDGVVMGYEFFGTNDAPGVTIGGQFNLGRTTTHELGHYFGLFHTFQGGCSSPNDSVTDTPAISGPTGGCPTTAADTCTGGGDDMFENYMDYTDDACMNIFTNGQKARMLNVINTSRVNLISNTIPEMPLPELAVDASIKIEGFDQVCGEQIPNIRLTNYGSSTITTATISYSINAGAPETFTYNGNIVQNEFDTFTLPTITVIDGSGTLNVSVSLPSTDQRVCNDTDSADYVIASPTTAEATQLFFSLTTDSFSNETTWEFRDGSDNVVASGGPYNGSTEDNTTFTELIPLGTNECYSFLISDSYGDGICCDYGTGSFEIRENDATGTLLVSGGDFGGSQQANILANSLGVNDYFLNSNLYIYPNPAAAILNIKLSNRSDLPDSYEIVNMLGQTITKKIISSEEDLAINTNALSNGMYFIKINKYDISVTKPFIKK
ncbi:M43 family zinc metalloprotease [Psychroserpens sp. Hel_I_66]|uniref:M43 family zinc metalloprotease n=1 Tax=Psychroserpens sp. Hel_I_66 TaxID=1250004 RepID=UPI0006909BEA|nr:M43 family zinc metalloprotease [Psychroserpens sp. Hel_I_66]